MPKLNYNYNMSLPKLDFKLSDNLTIPFSPVIEDGQGTAQYNSVPYSGLPNNNGAPSQDASLQQSNSNDAFKQNISSTPLSNTDKIGTGLSTVQYASSVLKTPKLPDTLSPTTTPKKTVGTWAKGAGQKINNAMNSQGMKVGLQAAFSGMSFMKDNDKIYNTNDSFASDLRSTFQNAAITSGDPYLMAAAGASKLSGILGINADASKGLGGGRDFVNLVGSLIPFTGLFGKKTAGLDVNQDVQASSGYTGVASSIRDAKNNAGATLLTGADQANNNTWTAYLKQEKVSDMLDNAENNKYASQSPLLNQKSQIQMSGGYSYIKNGAKLYNREEAQRILKSSHKKDPSYMIVRPPDVGDYKEGKKLKFGSKKPTYQDGGKINNYQDFVNLLNKTGRNDSNYDTEGFYNDKEAYSEWQQREKETPGSGHFTDLYKLPNHPTFSVDSKYNTPEKTGGTWSGDDQKGWTYTTSPYVEKQHSQQELIDYFIKQEPRSTLIYKGNPVFLGDFQKLKDGGTFNVIPEGALHKNKHHLENVDEKFEDVTTKGIPVVSESKEGELIQHAEVEKEEIIFRLEVTKKLEELAKEDTNESAIEAGKLLVKEVLHNTIDKTNNML